MTYLTRPVFQFEINWSHRLNQSFAFDLDELEIGFGAEVFTGLQTHVVRGWKCQIELTTPTEINSCDDFTAALTGRLQGFWFPAPLAAVKWKAAVDATHFDIEDQKLRDTWQDHPDIHLYFLEPNGTAQAAKITDVVQQGVGERITIDTALDPQPSASTQIYRLAYVRLAGDVEEGEFGREGCQTRRLQVIELPLEYTTYETGQRPIYLYHFWMDAPAGHHWRYTSFAADVVSGNELFTSFAISHRSLKASAKPESQVLEHEAVYDADHPLALFLPLAPQRPLHLEVFQVSYSDLETQTLLFTGQVRSISDAGDKLRFKGDAWQNILQRKFPRLMIQSYCNNLLFDAGCKAIRAAFETTAEITALDPDAAPPTVTCELLYDSLPQFDDWITEDWFAHGFIELGAGLEFEVRTIIASELTAAPKTLTLSLNAPLLHAAVGDTVQLIAGCDGRAATCKSKFNNFVNFGGFVAVPTRNLSLQAIDNVSSQGNKK